jgi:hypothetical protein
MILNKISWKILLSSPADLADLIINNLKIDENVKEQVLEIFNDWISFCLNESTIYYKYNQYEVTLACLYISLKYYNIVELCTEIRKLTNSNLIKTITNIIANLYNSDVYNSENISNNINKCKTLGMKRLRDSKNR